MTPIDAIFPKSCVFCGKAVSGADEGDGICAECREELPWYGASETLGSGLTVTAPLKYENAARAALLRFKFNGRTQYAGTFAKLMSVCVGNYYSGDFDIIAYVPLSFFRRLRRGYNQTKLLAAALSKELGKVPVTAPLKKRSRKANSSLGKSERAENVKNAFAVKRGADIRGKRILLVDDVLTTGATLTECASVLLRNGAERVMCVTLCKA
jgi:ComF family protein